MIWFLFLIGILLVVFNLRAIKKDKSSFNNIYHNEIEDMREFEFKLGEMRREFSETILELQKEIEEVKSKLNFYKSEDKSIEDNIKRNNIEENTSKQYNTKEKSIKEKKIREKNTRQNDAEENITKYKNDHVNYGKEFSETFDNKVEESFAAEAAETGNSKVKVEKNTSGSNGVKIDEINKLLSKGLSVEEVSEKLGIGKGEVLLIKDLYLK